MSELNLRAEDVDRLGQALITLTKELWVVKDRLQILEAVLAEAGVIGADTIDRFQPNEALNGRLEDERAELINQVLSTFAK